MIEVLAVLAGIIAFFGYIPYGIDIAKGRLQHEHQPLN
jgi:hypothetical protein